MIRLALLLASFALTAYAGVRLLEHHPVAVTAWLVGAAVMHDLALVPLYAGADRALRRVLGRGPLNHVRVPALLSLLLLAVYFPLITAHSPGYERATGMSAGVFLHRWLLITAGLFAASAAVAALRRLGRHAGRRLRLRRHRAG